MFCLVGRFCAPQHCFCALQASVARAEGQTPVPASNFPIASEARLAGDAKQTRFVLDLDKTIGFRAFTLADPYRVVVDIQVSFHFAQALEIPAVA